MGALFDGSSVWVTSAAEGKLLRLDSTGAILQTVTLAPGPHWPVFDGVNIWVPNTSSNSVSVVRASSGAVLATLTGNGLDGVQAGAFDGQRVLMTNGSGNSVSLWNAGDLSELGTVSMGAASNPTGVCSDGASFWVALINSGALARF